MRRRESNSIHRVGFLLAGVLALILIAVGATVALPASDPELNVRSSSARRFDAAAKRGMRVYSAEGCWYCHTQEVRKTATDKTLGAVLKPGDYDGQDPSLLGVERVGPDLTHIGSATTDADLMRLLKSPHSSMPSYEYLTKRQQSDLVAYLLSLR